MPLNRCVTSRGTGVGSGARRLVGRGGVAERDGDAPLVQQARGGEAGVGLGCQRHERHEARECGEQGAQPFAVGGAHEGDGMRTGRAAEERPLEVDAEDGRERRSSASARAAPARSSAAGYSSSGAVTSVGQ